MTTKNPRTTKINTTSVAKISIDAALAGRFIDPGLILRGLGIKFESPAVVVMTSIRSKGKINVDVAHAGNGRGTPKRRAR